MTNRRIVAVLASDVRRLARDATRNFARCCKCNRPWTKHVPSESKKNKYTLAVGIYCDQHAPCGAVDSDHAAIPRTAARLLAACR